MLSRRIGVLKPSPTIALTSKVKELRKKGIDVIGFGAGEPDIDTPDFIKEACIKAIKDGKTKYPPSAGIPELREAIAEKLKRENNVEYKPSEVVVTVGAKLALYLIFYALIDDGDEVLLPTPYWVTYEDQIKLCGGRPVYIKLSPQREFKLTYEDVTKNITTKTKLIVINSPANPTGMVFDPDELKRIAELCLERNILIISDECYEHLIYENLPFKSIASFSEDIKKITFTVNSFSKTFSMTGWRVGYVACPENYAKILSGLNSQFVSNTTTFAQYGALEALKNPESERFIESVKNLFRKRRDVIVEGLRSIEGVKVIKPEATFFIFPDFTPYTERAGGDVKFSEYLLEKALVAVVPGSAFGMEGYLRMSFALDVEHIEKGIERIKLSLEELE